MNNINAQDLSTHQWENRLVLVLANDTTQPDLKNQLKEFRMHEEGMEERKILVYQIIPQQYRTGLNRPDKWVYANNLFKNYKSMEADLEVILIGLDGGIKMRQAEFLSCKNLFAIIDGMPMRRAEMNREKTKG